jgi:hypothetical protein
MSRSAFILNHIESVIQPTDNVCGQTCVAMVVNRPIDEIIAVMGTPQGSFISEIRKTLKLYGFVVGNQISIPCDDDRTEAFVFPRCAICIVEWYNKLSLVTHAILLNNNMVYDPALGGQIPLHTYIDNLLPRDHRHLASYIAIKGKG